MKRPVYIDRPFYSCEDYPPRVPANFFRGVLWALAFMLGVAAVVFGVVWGASRL